MLFTTVRELYRTDRQTVKAINRQLYATLDTETAFDNIKRYFVRGTEGRNSLVYDLGILIHDLKGNVYGTLNLIITDTFLYQQEKMDSCYFKDKLQSYYIDIDNRQRELVSIHTARDIIDYIVNELNITTLEAYNIKFDYEALNHTYQTVTHSKTEFFPQECELMDIQKMLHSHIKDNRKYRSFCIKNGYLTKHKVPRPQEKAEVVYRYITRNNQFIEDHTGLKDCSIEKDIMVWLNKKNATYKTTSNFNKYEWYEVEMA